MLSAASADDLHEMSNLIFLGKKKFSIYLESHLLQL